MPTQPCIKISCMLSLSLSYTHTRARAHTHIIQVSVIRDEPYSASSQTLDHLLCKPQHKAHTRKHTLLTTNLPPSHCANNYHHPSHPHHKSENVVSVLRSASPCIHMSIRPECCAVCLQQHGLGVLHQFSELGQPLSSHCPVHHAMVAAQRHTHHAGYAHPGKE